MSTGAFEAGVPAAVYRRLSLPDLIYTEKLRASSPGRGRIVAEARFFSRA